MAAQADRATTLDAEIDPAVKLGRGKAVEGLADRAVVIGKTATAGWRTAARQRPFRAIAKIGTTTTLAAKNGHPPGEPQPDTV